MPDKLLRMSREAVPRPVLLAVGGDSASGKTTLTRGLVAALGADRCTSVCLDDYHRYDRQTRHELGLTVNNPDSNYLDIIEQHLQMLATGQPILKPVYDHRTGTFGSFEHVRPREFVIVEGLFPLHTRLTRACFDLTVFLDPPDEVRRAWKLQRDTAERGYTAVEVLADLAEREADSAGFIRPQRRHADIVVRFAHVPTRPDEPMSAEVLLRSTVRHPPLAHILTDDVRSAMHLKIIRDSDGTPVDCLHVHGHAQPEEISLLEKAIWDGVGAQAPLPDALGRTGTDGRSAPLAVTQLLLLQHLVAER